MATIKTSELKGKALDYAVAICIGFKTNIFDTIYIKDNMVVCKINESSAWNYWKPSENPAQAWPIIEREKIDIVYRNGIVRCTGHCCSVEDNESEALSAALRCYVLCLKGDTIEIPDELL